MHDTNNRFLKHFRNQREIQLLQTILKNLKPLMIKLHRVQVNIHCAYHRGKTTPQRANYFMGHKITTLRVLETCGKEKLLLL